MDYTRSNSFVTDPGTTNRMHLEAQAVPTAVSDSDMNQVIWSLMEIVKAAGLAGAPFDKAVPATYQKLLSALRSPGVFQTPQRFNDSSRPATTQFLASNGFAYRKGPVIPTNGNYNVSFEEAGAIYEVNGNNSVIRLPSTALVQEGTAHTFRIIGVGVVIAAQNGEGVGSVAGTYQQNLMTRRGEAITLVRGGGYWYVTSAGFGAEAYAGGTAANDYQLSPSGFILQWGIATFPNTGTTVSSAGVTYPIAFPSVNLFAFCTPRLSANSTAGGITPVSTTSSSTTGAVFTADTLNFTTFNRSINGFYFAGGR